MLGTHHWMLGKFAFEAQDDIWSKNPSAVVASAFASEDDKVKALKDGYEISLKDESKEINIVQESIVSQEREIPEYLEVDIKEFKGKFLRAPLIHDVPYPVTMEPNLVIEYYSR